jgi:uncharacterized protein (TIGR02145 family)
MKKLLLMLTLTLLALAGCKKEPASGQDQKSEQTVVFTLPANCYIVSKEGTYSFKTLRGNLDESVGEVVSVEVLWESFGTDVEPAVGDLIKSVSYKDGEIVFEATDKKGNAVIAAKDPKDIILWSWHIWLTDTPQEVVYNNEAGTMMDRNLGATSVTPGDICAFGLFYQWGRKDPFLGSSSVTDLVYAVSTIDWPATVASDPFHGTIEFAVANPTTYITCNGGNYDWYYTRDGSVDNARWVESGRTKSVYDPCPAGWRIPDGGENSVWAKAGWDNTPYDKTNMGMSFATSSPSTTWYPSAGCLVYALGDLNSVGSGGFYASASPSTEHYAYNLFFSEHGTVTAKSSNVRANAMSVRCIKE